MGKKNTPPVGQATPEQIAQWKKDNADGVYAVEVKGHVAYFRNPDIDDMNAAASLTTKDAPLDYFKILANDTYLGGSKEVFESRPLFLDFIETIKPKLDGKKGKLLDL